MTGKFFAGAFFVSGGMQFYFYQVGLRLNEAGSVDGRVN